MIPFNRTPKWLFQTGVYYTLSRSALMVLGCLTDCIDSREYAGNIRTTTVVTKTGLSKQSVCAALSELIEAGIIRREKGQARFTICTEQEVKHALPRSSTVDLNGQAHLTERSSTVDHKVKHALPPRGRNKDSPRTSNQEHTYQEEEAKASASDGLRFMARCEEMISRTGFPRPDGRSLDELRKAADRIRSGMYPEAIGIDDPIEWLEPRLKWYWDDQAARRADAEKRLAEPSLRKTLAEDRWRVDLDHPIYKPSREDTDEYTKWLIANT